MGKLLKPRGLEGALWLMVFNDVNTSLKPGKQVWIQMINGDFLHLSILSLNISMKKSWIKFHEYCNRDEASKLSGLQLSMSRNDFASISSDEVYLVDLIGVEVLNDKKNYIGVVIDTMVMPTQNLLVVDYNGEEILIPFVDTHVRLFDKLKNIIIINDCEGLLY